MKTFRHDLSGGRVLRLEGDRLTIEDVVAVARFRRRVAIGDRARRRIERCRAMVDVLLGAGEKVYGLTTGFGKLRDVAIPVADTRRLQENLIRSHACGVGDPFPEDVVRAAMLLRANTLCLGHSGIRLATVEALVQMLNDDVYPFVPEKGSVGASGDLAPLSHLILVLMGDPEGRYFPRARRTDGMAPIRHATREDFVPMPGPGAFKAVAQAEGWRFRPVVLEAKEGLALNNGTQFMAAVACLATYDSFFTLRAAELAGAMSLEAAHGVRGAYDERIHRVRDHEHQADCARRVLSFCRGSQILGLLFNPAHVHRARMHLREAREFLNRLERDRERAGRPTPPTLRASLREIRALDADLGRLIPLDGDGHVKAAWIARELRRGPREQIRRFNSRLASLRHRAIEILSGVERNASFNSSLVRKTRTALVAAVAQLNQAVPDSPIIQDDYSFRCFPQVLACAYRALWHVAGILAVEINAATDNPLLFPPRPQMAERLSVARYRRWLREHLDDCRAGVIGGGNFHGQPVAAAMDYLAMAMAEVADIAERRIAHLVDESHSRGLPPFLIDSSGLNSGFMIPQYTAAALVSENKILTHPASVDSIPTCAGAEDHVSMGTIAARKAAMVLENVRTVVAIEVLSAYQGLKFREPLQPGQPIRRVIQHLRACGVQQYEDDRVPYPDIERVRALLTEPNFLSLLVPPTRTT